MKSSKQQILLAEDDTNFGMMLKIFLEMNGFNVTLCENGEQALQAYKEKQYDLCILDVMMPKMDGFSVAEALVARHNSVPFVFLTAKGLKEDQVKGYQLGASDYLVKPFDPEILLLKVNVLLRNSIKSDNKNAIYQIGSYTFDYERRTLTLTLNGDEQRLSPKEAELAPSLRASQRSVVT